MTASPTHTSQLHDLISPLNYQHVCQCHDSVTSTCVSVNNHCNVLQTDLLFE